MIDMPPSPSTTTTTSWSDWLLDPGNLCGGDTTTTAWTTNVPVSAPTAAIEKKADEGRSPSEDALEKPSALSGRNLPPPPPSPAAMERVTSSIEVSVVPEGETTKDGKDAEDEVGTIPSGASSSSATKTTTNGKSTSSSTRFRKLRKSASRVTGWSGALSKRKESEPIEDEEVNNSVRTKVLVMEEEEEKAHSLNADLKIKDAKETKKDIMVNEMEKEPAPLVLQQQQDALSAICCPAPSFGTEQTSATSNSTEEQLLPEVPICDWDVRSGTMNNMTPEQEQALDDLERIMFEGDEPLRHCTAHEHEDRRRMLLRFLRGQKFHVQDAQKLLRSHADFWHDFEMDVGMNNFQEEPNGLYFQCGRDIYNHPVMVARPCLHLAKQDSDTSLKRIVHSLTYCCQHNIGPNSDGTVVLYDCAHVKMSNFDLAFAKKLVSILDPHFPERVVSIIIINNSWALQGMWALVSPLLDPATRQKIVVCGHDYKVAKKQWLGENHPYLKQCEGSGSQKNKRKRRHGSNEAAAVVSEVPADISKTVLEDSVVTITPVVSTPEMSVGFHIDPSCCPSDEVSFVVADPTKPDCPIVHTSDALLRCTGYTANAVIGKNYLELLQGEKTSTDTVATVSQYLADMNKKRNVSMTCGGLSCRILCYRRDGSCFWNDLHVAPLRAPVWCKSKKTWEWKTRLLVAVQLDCTSIERKEQSGDEQPLCDWNVDASCKRVPPIEPPPLLEDNHGEQVVTGEQLSKCLDPAQAIALAIETSLQQLVFEGTISANTDDSTLRGLVHTQLAKLRATATTAGTTGQKESLAKCVTT